MAMKCFSIDFDLVLAMLPPLRSIEMIGMQTHVIPFTTTFTTNEFSTQRQI